jgi:hypothetical protein
MIRSGIRSNARNTILSRKTNRAYARNWSTRLPTGGLRAGIDIQNKLLSLLYVKCRQNFREPGIGDAELERLSGCPAEHLEFHLWCLKGKAGSERWRMAPSRSPWNASIVPIANDRKTVSASNANVVFWRGLYAPTNIDYHGYVITIPELKSPI